MLSVTFCGGSFSGSELLCGSLTAGSLTTGELLSGTLTGDELSVALLCGAELTFADELLLELLAEDMELAVLSAADELCPEALEFDPFDDVPPLEQPVRTAAARTAARNVFPICFLFIV